MPHSPRTERLAKTFPSWTKIYHDPNAKGRELLDISAHSVDDINAYLIQESRNLHLDTMDIDLIDHCFVGELPDKIHHHWTVNIFADYRKVSLVETPKEFYQGEGLIAYIDWPAHQIFFRDEYSKIHLQAMHKSDSVSQSLEISRHHVWNNFDEIGLLLNTPRLFMESNEEYRDRLYYVYQYPGSSTRLGLIHGIAKDTGLIQKKVWENPQEDSSIPITAIPETIRVNGKPYENIQVTDDAIVLSPLESAEVSTITYIQDIEAYALHQKDQVGKLRNILYNENGTPKEELLNAALYINKISPILWGFFKFDETEWDIINPSFCGIDFVPNLLDSPTHTWDNYVTRS